MATTNEPTRPATEEVKMDLFEDDEEFEINQEQRVLLCVGNSEMSVRKKQADEKAQPPPIKLVKLDKAYKLAMQWVNDMSGRWEDEQAEVELEGRPSKLGLGAEISYRNDARQPNNEATEWKLRAMLDTRKRKTSNNEDFTNVNNTSVSEDEEDESESRCNAFAKKRVYPAISPVSGKRRK